MQPSLARSIQTIRACGTWHSSSRRTCHCGIPPLYDIPPPTLVTSTRAHGSKTAVTVGIKTILLITHKQTISHDVVIGYKQHSTVISFGLSPVLPMRNLAARGSETKIPIPQKQADNPVLLSHAALSRLHNSQLFIQLSHSGAVATVTRMQCVYDTSRMHSSGRLIPFGHAPCGPYIGGKSTPCRQTYN